MILLFLLLIFSCSTAEMLNAPESQNVDTLINITKSHKDFIQFQRDTIKKDTTKIPIFFNPTVQDWNEINVNSK